MSLPPDSPPYDAVLQQHRLLRQLLRQIEVALDEQQLGIADVGELLGRLGDQMIRHFALEESGGYLAEALLNAPQLVRRANDLLAQHPKMARRVESLVTLGAATDQADWWAETRRRFAAFVEELRQHERLEDRLLQEAYTHDLHASD